MSNALELACTRAITSGQAREVTEIFGQTRQILDNLEKGDSFIWPDKIWMDTTLSVGEPPTAAPGTPEYKAQLDAFRPVYFIYVEVDKNENNPERVGCVCRLYLKSLCKRVFEYTKADNGRIVPTKRYIQSGGNVFRLTQTVVDFNDVHKRLTSKRVNITDMKECDTRKYKPKGSTEPDELVSAHTYDLECPELNS